MGAWISTSSISEKEHHSCFGPNQAGSIDK